MYAASAKLSCRTDSVADPHWPQNPIAADSSILLFVSCHSIVKKTAILPAEPDENSHYQSEELQSFPAATFICGPVSFITRPTKAAPLDVITPGLIFRLPHPNLALRLLCVIGLCFGAASFLRGLRLRRIRAHTPDSSQPISWEANRPFLDRTEKTAPDPIQEIIHLSSDPVPMKSAEMTQQQKIAAALARAGTIHSSAWIRESSGVAVEATEPDPSENQTTPVQEVHSTPLTPTQKFADTSHLLIWSGLALAVLCCYLLVTFR